MQPEVVQVRGLIDRQRLLSSRVWYLHLAPSTDQERVAWKRIVEQEASGTATLVGSLESRVGEGLFVAYGRDILGRVAKCDEGRWLDEVPGGSALPLELEIHEGERLRAALRAPRLWPIARYFDAPQLAQSKEATFLAFVDDLIQFERVPTSYEQIALRHWFPIQEVLSSYDDWERRHVRPLPPEMEDDVNFDTVPGWKEAAR